MGAPDLNQVNLVVTNWYNGEKVDLDGDYYEPERERIKSHYTKKYFEYEPDSIMEDILFLIDSLSKIPNVIAKIEEELEQDRKYLIKQYTYEIEELSKDYEEHKSDPENRKYRHYDMPGRVENHLKPWVELLQRPKFFMVNERNNKQFKIFSERTKEFIDYVGNKINEEINRYKKAIELSDGDLGRDTEKISKTIEIINKLIEDTIKEKKKKTKVGKTKLKNITKKRTEPIIDESLIELDKQKIDKFVNYLKKYIEQKHIPTTTPTEEIEIVYQNYKIHFNLKIKDIVRLLYIAYQENEKLTEKYYNFQNHQNIYNFIDKYCVIYKVSGKPETINKETLQRYYRDTIKNTEPYREWEQNKYYTQFSQALNELDQNNTN